MKSKAPESPLLRTLRDLPIRRKLLVILMAVTTAALATAGLGILMADSLLYRRYLERDLTALAHIAADNSTAALSFDVPKDASETLHALQARTHVVTACIYRENGEKFAGYSRPDVTAACPPPAQEDRVRFTSSAIDVSQAVMLKGERIGTLVILYDMDELYARMRVYGLTVLAILLVSSLVAFLLSAQLRGVIATPIAQLSEITAAVSETKDYGIRAETGARDELGRLVNTFNEMLAGIQSRDRELRNALLAREEALREAQRAETAVVQMNLDLKSSNERLARSNEDLERFAFAASHDLQEPLRMITTYSQLLVRGHGAQLEGEAPAFLRNIVEGAMRMRGLLTDLLAYSEIGGDPDEPAGLIDLNQVLATVRRDLEVMVQESGAVIEPAPLPAVPGHEGHFLQLFQNLLSNAIKYRSEAKPRIQIRCEREPGMLRFAVADNGMGIDPAYHDRIFGVFKRLHGKKIPGTGIGLAICQRVVERYGGRIWVESLPGEGATFFFTIPLRHS